MAKRVVQRHGKRDQIQEDWIERAAHAQQRFLQNLQSDRRLHVTVKLKGTGNGFKLHLTVKLLNLY